jgi:hypothetical protein
VIGSILELNKVFDTDDLSNTQNRNLEEIRKIFIFQMENQSR